MSGFVKNRVAFLIFFKELNKKVPLGYAVILYFFDLIIHYFNIYRVCHWT